VSFTSGTTGRPKGIVTAHAPLPHFIDWHVAQHGLARTDRFSMLSGLAHDPLLRDLFTPLSIGAVLCIPAAAALQQPDTLAAWLAAQTVSVAHLTPALGDLIATGCGRTLRLEALRHLFWGGELLTARTIAPLREVAPQAQQVNFYGTTETPQAMAHWPVPAGRLAHAQPVGRGIADAQLLLLRPDGSQAGIGESAEIWIRTPYLALGYLDDAALTEVRFVRNPFSTDPHDRCYRTGDLGRHDSDGNVVVLGRIDDQINVRGLRVEPAEIERVAQSVPGVDRALVRPLRNGPVKDGATDAALLLYYSCRAGAEVAPAALESRIRQALPSAMWPRAVLNVRAFTLLPNGKVDLRALPSIEQAGRPTAPSAADHDAPRGATESAIAQVWQELLGVGRLSRADNFFDLGGHSLLAVRAAYAIEQRCGLRLELRRLVHESLAQLAVPPLAPQTASEPDGSDAAGTRAGLVGRLLGGIGWGRPGSAR
jgi:acyl-coenzyme A synthetase/AMP-(fatty) acid ligase